MNNDITPTNSTCPVFLEPADPEQVLADKAEHKKTEQLLAAQAAARQAVLDKLGLTQDEAQALLG
jgi:hypothetical protein